MEILDVSLSPKVVSVNEKFHITFSVSGAEGVYFVFPFSNESLTENTIEFTQIKEAI